MNAIRRNGLLCALLVACAALASCTDDAPTGVKGTSAAPAMSNGVGFGSGNRSGGDSATVQNTQAADSTESTAEERTGVGFGSGN
jgi:hypothetical protein